MVGAVRGYAGDPPPLLERERELATVAAAVDAAAAGHGSVLWVEGPAGIGKTRLLRAARAHAERSGVRVLRARASELEREFAFGVVRGLFEPAVAAEPGVLASGPARLAAPVVTLTEDTSVPAVVTAERLHGLYWLTVALADGGPLLLLVDDAHWADEPSLRALAYLARRVEELPVAIMIATRPGSDRATDSMREDPQAVVLRPGPLTPGTSDERVRAALGDEADPAFLRACRDATGGNPMLLHALLAALREDGVAPDAGGVDAVRQRGQAIVATFVLPRLRQLPPAAGALARAVAVLGPAAELRRAAALADLDPAAAGAAADALTAAELLARGRPLAFAHPLIADALLERMSAAEQHRGHDRAARCLAADGADPERVAAHLLATEHLADGWVVERLRAAADAATAKGAPKAAVTYLRRAMDEPPDPAIRPELLLHLGMAQIQAADGDGFATLRDAWRLTPDPVAAGRVALIAVARAAVGGQLRSRRRDGPRRAHRAGGHRPGPRGRARHRARARRAHRVG